MPDTPTAPARDFRADARALLRQWIGAPEGDVAAAVDALGRRAIAEAADASARLARGVAATQGAQQSLDTLQALARSLDAPRPARSFFARRPRPQEAPDAAIETLIQNLDHERDAIARARITLDTDLRKLEGAADALEAARGLVHACAAAAEAAARELAVDRPDRARFFRETVAERLLAREQDILTQAAVTQQGLMTLGVIAEGQDALAQALGRARDTSVAALRTALAARQAVAGSRALAEQAEALARTTDAAQDAGGRRDVQRAMEDAIAQARRAIDAAESGGRHGLTPL
ncbi:toxic anion resistance protein [Sphingomonas sp. CJ20]